MLALNKGVAVASILVLIFAAIIISQLYVGREAEGWRVFASIAIGLAAGILIGQVTEYFTSYSYYPTRSITNAGKFVCS